jgi:hypothetical protein
LVAKSSDLGLNGPRVNLYQALYAFLIRDKEDRLCRNQ